MKRRYSGTPRETIPLRVLDFFVDLYAFLFYKRRKIEPIAPNPVVLVASLGHLGDALTVSYLFPIIKAHYPQATIDTLSPTWCNIINENNPFVRQNICIDHFLSNRSNVSRWQKIKQFYQTIRSALPLLRQQHYDFYIDVRTSDSVSHFILPFINVKKAIGYNRRGLGGLLDVELEYPDEFVPFHHFDTYTALLKEIGVASNLEELKPYFPIASTIDDTSINSKLGGQWHHKYILVFPEAGEERRQLSVGFWEKMLSEVLTMTDYQIIFCGQTSLSAQIIASLAGFDTARFLDTSGKLSIPELAFLAQKAQFAFALDSFPVHLCCIFCRTITFFKGTGISFFPIANHQVLLFHSHLPSKDLLFVRKNVKIIYQQEIESDFVRYEILKRLEGYDI
ncbi:MAG: glycosyltransferase family 9 protein [Runella sp.]